MIRLYFIVLAFLIAIPQADAQRDVSGTWQGALSLGSTSLLVTVNIAGAPTSYTATMDIPQQGAKGLPVSSVRVAGDSLLLAVDAVAGAARGRIAGDSFSGIWTQGAASVPMRLRRLAAGARPVTLARPQTPVAPFPYKSTDVRFTAPDSSILYGATLTCPQGKGPFPAVLLLTGSGQQNRDEEVFGHKPFAVIADYLTRRGYAVLRVDDRDIGETTGDAENATTQDFAGDAAVALDYLKSQPFTDKTRLGLLGHSEGGMLAQLVAAQREDISFVVLLAAPGQRLIDLMTEQNRLMLTSAGIDTAAAASYVTLYRRLAAAMTDASLDDGAAAGLAAGMLDAWVAATPADRVLRTTGIRDAETKQAFLTQMVGTLRRPWFRYFMQYDPDPYVRRMRAKVLALNGDRDLQVPAGANLAALKASLGKGRSAGYKVEALKGLNHLFQTCRQCTAMEYGQLEETFSPQALAVIGAWLKAAVK